MVVDLPKMFPWQQKVFFGLKQHWKNSIHVIKSRRQCGKSILAEIILLTTALQEKRQRAYILEPSFAQCDKVLNELIDMVKGKPFFKKYNALRRQILFINGSEIRLFSAEQGSEILRGWTCETLIIDEAAYISDEIIDTVFPYVNVSKGPILMFSTPRGKSGNFYTYYDMGMSAEMNNVWSYDWADEDVSALLPPEKIALYRKTMDPLAFTTDYLGQFLNGQSRFFGNFSQCIKDRQMVVNEDVVLGIDWAGSTGGDYTAITVMGVSGQLYNIVYFNDKEPQQTLDAIEDIVVSYRVKKVTVELNSIGNIYFAMLKSKLFKYRIPVLGFTTTNDSKDKIISKLQVAFQNSAITIYEERELMDELEFYEMTYSKTGKRVFNACPPHHDDLIMSLAIGYNSIQSGNYSVA